MNKIRGLERRIYFLEVEGCGKQEKIEEES